MYVCGREIRFLFTFPGREDPSGFWRRTLSGNTIGRADGDSLGTLVSNLPVNVIVETSRIIEGPTSTGSTSERVKEDSYTRPV